MTPPSREMVGIAYEKVRQWIEDHQDTGLAGAVDEAEEVALIQIFALALTAAHAQGRADTWKEAAQEHRRHCPSFSCRDGKAPCNEYETYLARAAEEARRG